MLRKGFGLLFVLMVAGLLAGCGGEATHVAPTASVPAVSTEAPTEVPPAPLEPVATTEPTAVLPPTGFRYEVVAEQHEDGLHVTVRNTGEVAFVVTIFTPEEGCSLCGCTVGAFPGQETVYCPVDGAFGDAFTFKWEAEGVVWEELITLSAPFEPFEPPLDIPTDEPFPTVPPTEVPQIPVAATEAPQTVEPATWCGPETDCQWRTLSQCADQWQHSVDELGKLFGYCPWSCNGYTEDTVLPEWVGPPPAMNCW